MGFLLMAIIPISIILGVCINKNKWNGDKHNLVKTPIGETYVYEGGSYDIEMK